MQGWGDSVEKTQYSYKRLNQNCYTNIRNRTRRGNHKIKEGKPENGTNERKNRQTHKYENTRNIKPQDINKMKGK